MLEALLLTAVYLTSLISGVLGMAGGMILMGVYGLLLPVATAMILHGVTQLASNGFRAVLFRRHIVGAVLLPYFAGALLCLAAFFGIRLIPNKAVVFILLGLLPYFGWLKPKGWKLDVTRRPTAFFCGALVTSAQLLAGVSGPLLDIFFLEADMDRHQVIGTKAVTQAVGHSLKLIYYGNLALMAEPLGVPPWIFLAAIAVSFAGTATGRRIVGRLSDAWFRRAGAWVLLGLGAAYVYRGLLLLD